jgi:preprotein translocase subunit SecF
VFQILKKTNIDFMRRRKIYLVFSSILMVLALTVLGVKWLNLGIEFTGGTEMQVKYVTAPDLSDIRSSLKNAGLGSPVVTTIGAPELNEVYVRLGVAAESGDEGDLTSQVMGALHSAEDLANHDSGMINLNETNEEALRANFQTAPGLSPDDAEALAVAISEYRRENAVIRSYEDLQGLAGMTPEAMEYLREQMFIGKFALRSQSFIGPTIGAELLKKAMLAILGSLVGVLCYIAIRFQVQWGVAALAALFHDTVITLGLFSLFNQQMSLPVVAAFLTLIGYSVNDTVVVFDRIRENLRLRGNQKLIDVVNKSLNQTLSRTVITSGSTWFVVVGLWIMGGEALRPFAFVLTIGVIVGTYSSICIASPVLVLWKEAALRKKVGGARS